MMTMLRAGRAVPAPRRSWFSRLISLAARPLFFTRPRRSARLDIRALSPHLQRDMGFVDAAPERGAYAGDAAETATPSLPVFAK